MHAMGCRASSDGLCLRPADLAPGDGVSARAELSGLRFHRVASPRDPAADTAYEALAREFGPRGEMEAREVIEARLRRTAAGDGELLYEMILVEDESGTAAVRDHTAVLVRGAHTARAVVHLSHVWVQPGLRGQGLAGWLRAVPLEAARRLARRAGAERLEALTLAAEMEHPDPPTGDRVGRLRAYGRAGFLAVDPVAVPYHQPNFRPQEAIDAGAGCPPLPMRLVIRRVGREQERELPGAEVRALVDALYHTYAADLRAEDIHAVEATLTRYPADHERVALVDPTT